MSENDAKVISLELTNKLFPLPSAPPSTLCPTRVFGISSDSTEAVIKFLKENFSNWHIFFNDRGFHNHTPHHLLALYALGAPAQLIEGAYRVCASYQRPIGVLGYPEPITTSNFSDHLGDETYYPSYLRFFSELLEKSDDHGAILEEFILSAKYNPGPENDISGTSGSIMLNRFMGGLVHPFIHAGHGFEFGIPGVLAEGLAMTAVHNSEDHTLAEGTFFDGVAEELKEDSLNGALTSLSKLTLNGTKATTTNGKHALVIISHMANDAKLKSVNAGKENVAFKGDFAAAAKAFGHIVAGYAEEWDVSNVGRVPGELDKKLEELYWMQTVIYGIGGWKKGTLHNADFFLMHLVTSVLFLPSILQYLKPAYQRLLLRAYFYISLLWWVARGRPSFSIAEFYESTSTVPSSPGPTPVPNDAALVGPIIPNPWFAILQTTMMHPDEHLIKLQRSLAHGAYLYGSRPKGHFKELSASSVQGGLEGAEYLDGSLFIRVAGLTADRHGWLREGSPKGSWDRHGYFE